MVSGVVLFFYHARVVNDAYWMRVKLVDNAVSGVNMILSDSAIDQEEQTLDLFGTGVDSVRMVRRAYGLMDLAISEAFAGPHRARAVALVGSVSRSLALALYLSDRNQPLSLAGRTEILGDCRLPKAAVKRAYIEGKPFIGEKLVSGNIFISTADLPRINETRLKKIMTALGTDRVNADDARGLAVFNSRDTLTISFLDSTLVIASNDAISIADKCLVGNIVIVSRVAIHVSATAKLENVQLIAPNVYFEKNVTATVQAYASNTLVVAAGCHLRYPSCVGVIADPEGVAVLQLDSTSLVEGCVFFAAKESQTRSLRFVIDRGAVVYGQVYASDYLELKGAVYGSTVCKGFTLNTPSARYQNHLLDATLDRASLNVGFVAPLLLSDFNRSKVIAWVK